MHVNDLFDYETAIEHVEQGGHAARASWNRDFIRRKPAHIRKFVEDKYAFNRGKEYGPTMKWKFADSTPTMAAAADDPKNHNVKRFPSCLMKVQPGRSRQFGYLPTNEDTQAHDWILYERS
ncbi:hypothetical protein MTBPR1_10080 [Candidatus Terasakiella magnetica]|uniref:Thoeris anti-defense 2-like domain-containing protein n=1 Tax=Candidatus Terasakiella magnetica TaxID=1867952 RepID=A0A1C3RC22_9PROT|nr:MW1434 family type I TA system toxin [Candidatus Terasakiella magnetica]SCA54833.1 hypothetical protein MTBPR1_10080 [Candidatus Terasakiella magnetica]